MTIMAIMEYVPTSAQRPVRVYLLDDHEVVRRGLRRLIEEDPGFEVVGESASAQEASRRIPALRPDVMVLDLRLPDGSGVDVCRTVRSIDPSIKGLVLTSYDDDEAVLSAIMAGASGYILKRIISDDLLDAVRLVAAGKSLLDPDVTAHVLDLVRNGQHEPEEFDQLSAQERRVLFHIANGLTNRQIAEQMSLTEKTVKNYVSHLLAKLGFERRTQAAVLAAKIFRSG